MLSVNEQRQHALAVLEREFKDGTGFVRIHAAEVLCEHGYGHLVTPAMQQEIETITPGYRLGVWRVMARVARDEPERQQYVERLRRAMLDETAPDRIGAAESLAKLGVADRADRAPLEQWLAKADDPTAVFPLWLRLLSGTEAEQAADEKRLARHLDSTDEIARLRAGYVLGWIPSISAESVAQLNHRVEIEPAGSQARVYIIAGSFLRAERESAVARALKSRLLKYIEAGTGHEQFAVGTVLGRCGSAETDLPALTRLLASPEADGRIGAAGALLHLLR